MVLSDAQWRLSAVPRCTRALSNSGVVVSGDVTTVRTTCKVGACEPYCGIEADVADGQMVAIRGDKGHPVSKGYLCVKGHHLLEYQNDRDRLLQPMRRTGDSWAPVDWQTATSTVGQQLQAIAAVHGPEAVATYWGNSADSANIVLALTTAGAFGSRNTYNVLSLEFTDRGAVASRVYGDEGVMLQPDASNTHHALLSVRTRSSHRAWPCCNAVPGSVATCETSNVAAEP